jgi:hypothetical protein
MLDAQEGEVSMQTMRMVLSALALLSLTAVGFAADAPQPTATPPTEAPVHTECVDGMRMPGLYMGPDGVLHHVPKVQPCSMKAW